MGFDCSEWGSRLEGMTSQELYHLNEMIGLRESIGMEEVVPRPNLPLQPPDSFHSIDHSLVEKRFDLGQRIWEQIQRISWNIFNEDALCISVYAKHEGVYPFVALWDHWQLSLKDVVCHESRSAIKPSLAVRKQYLWNDDIDE